MLAPAGTPVGAGELVRWAGAVVRGGSTDAVERLRSRIGDRLELAGGGVVAAGSARALLTLLLQELSAGRPERTEVVVPGYTCYSVAASIVRAGLSVRPLEIDPRTLSYEPGALEALEPDPVLAIVSANLFGMPDDLPRLERFAEERSVHLIDDAAQALGARVAGRPVGSFGTAGLLSLDKGKPLTSLRGGLLVTRDPVLAEGVARRVPSAEGPGDAGVGERVRDLVRMLGYGALLRPGPYGIVDRVLELGRTVYDPGFPVEPYPPHLAPMALGLLDRLDEVNRGRSRTARMILDALPEGAGIELPRSARPDTEGIDLRLPLLMESAEARDRALAALHRAGLGATGYYPLALIDVPGLAAELAPDPVDTPGAREVAARLLTLPTHGYVTERDVQRMRTVLSGR